MGIFSEKDAELREQGEIKPFSLTGNTDPKTAPASFDDDAEQQAEADTAAAALSLLNDGETSPEGDDGDEDDDESETAAAPKEDTADKKKAEHEAAEAKRKAEWEAKQAEKKAAAEKALQELFAMSDDDVMGSSVKRTGADLERLTRRNMKMCVTEVIQTICLDDPAFARLVCHPSKSLINCFKYINKKAEDFVKSELEIRGEKMSGTVGEDVPDDLCYKWAEEYFRDLDAEVDKDKDDKFVPKPYYGGGSSSSKSKKKEPPKPKTKPEPKPAEVKPSIPSEQMNLFGGVAV